MFALVRRIATFNGHFSANATGFQAVFQSHKLQQVSAITVILCAVWVVTTFWHFGLPGLYYDEANHIAFIPGILSQQAALLTHNRLWDNFIDVLDEIPRFPILGGSFYSSAIDAYIGLPFFLFFGFSLESARLFYALVQLMTVLACAFLVLRIAGRSAAVLFGIIALTDPSIVLAARTDANMFFFVVLFAVIAGHILLTYQRSSAPSTLLPLACGVMIACSVMAYFVGAFIALPLAISALILMRHRFRHQVALLAGMFLGYFPVIYAILSVYLTDPQSLATFGMPEFAVRAQAGLSTFSMDNVMRFLEMLEGTFGNFALARGVAGSFDTDFSTIRIVLVLAICIVTAAAISLSSHLRSENLNKSIAVLFLAIFMLFACASFVLKSMGVHHWVPLVLLFYVFVFIAPKTKVSKLITNLVIAALIIVNCVALVRTQQALAQTGGYAAHNESYSLPAILWRTTLRQYTPVFIDWGFSLQFLFQTAGMVPYVSKANATPSDIEALLKEPGPIAVITERNPDEMRRLLGDHIETELPFYQRDGVYLYSIFLLKPVAATLDERNPRGLNVIAD